MTIEELEYGAPAGTNRGGGGYDRTPPQDLDAERSVLGGMMISKDAIADVVEQIRGTDFYRPAHESCTTRSSTSTVAVSRPTPSPSPTS